MSAPTRLRRLVEAAAPAALLADTLAGLSRSPKSLPSRYFYDSRGSVLFERICETPEYYLTRCELAIMNDHVAEMAAALGPGLRLVEFGSGSGEKTRRLLSALERPAAYVPVEIAEDALTASSAALRREYPGLAVLPVQADFTAGPTLPRPSASVRRTAIYLAGSTLGNFVETEAVALLRQMRRAAGPDGAVLLGLDLKKDPAVIHAAYNDSDGITAEFTLNLLSRLNRDLGADFDTGQFFHRAVYREAAGRIETDIVSRRDQVVHVTDRGFHFAIGEAMRVEVSCKYDRGDATRLARAAGLQVQRWWTDAQDYFAVVLLVPQPVT